MGSGGARGTKAPENARPVDPPASDGASARPSEAQRRYLERGLSEPGGKLPLFDREGREVSRKTIEACIAHGWAEPWFQNPIKPDWLVCKLTPAGKAVIRSGIRGQRSVISDDGS